MSIKKMLEPLLEVIYGAIVGIAMGLPFAFIIVKGCQVSMRHFDSRNNERLDRMELRLQALELQRGDAAK